MSLLSRAIGKLDTVVGELPPETQEVIVTALREILRNSAALGDQVGAHLATVDEKTQRKAVRALESLGLAMAWAVVKGGGFQSIGPKLADASAGAPHMRRALTAIVDATNVVDATVVPPGKGG